MELECQVMHYDWGQLGIYSSIAEFVQKNNSRKHKFIEPRKPYAELWVGTHHLAPCYIKGTRQTLFEHIATTMKPGFENVPFIMKILSVESALSIQIHPSKDGVKYLLNQRHDLLSDENHKPELFYTLTDFEMFYGFRPISEIVFFLENIPELFELSGIAKLEKDGPAEVLEQQIKKSFRTLVSSKKEDVIVNYMSLIEESKERTDEQNERLLIPLVRRLAATNQYDTGLFLIYYLNYATLKAGEAMYVAPHDIHSYIKGECIEVQACSDNVIRAGLTKKRRNVNLFCDLVNFAFEKPEGKTMQPVKENDYTYIYRPPVPDFLLVRIEAKAEPGKMIQLNVRNTYSFLLVFKGRGEFIENHLRIQQGSVLYLEKNQDMGDLIVEDDLLMFQALENIDVEEPETAPEEKEAKEAKEEEEQQQEA